LIRINLLTEAKAAAARKKTPILPTGARLNNLLFFGGLLLCLVAAGGWSFVRVQQKRRLAEEISRARLEADRLRSIIDEVKGYEEKKKNLEEKIALINNLKTNQKGPVRLMDEISKALPDLVWLSNIEVVGNTISMKGKTLAPTAVATYLENLKKSPFFAEPVFRMLGQDGGTQGTYSWEMVLTFKPAAAYAAATGGLPSEAAPPASPQKKGA
jgi:type IV pilus assembly protein PilN